MSQYQITWASNITTCISARVHPNMKGKQCVKVIKAAVSAIVYSLLLLTFSSSFSTYCDNQSTLWLHSTMKRKATNGMENLDPVATVFENKDLQQVNRVNDTLTRQESEAQISWATTPTYQNKCGATQLICWYNVTCLGQKCRDSLFSSNESGVWKSLAAKWKRVPMMTSTMVE